MSQLFPPSPSSPPQGSSGTLGYVIRRRAAAQLAYRYAIGNYHHIDFLMLSPVRDGTLQVRDGISSVQLVVIQMPSFYLGTI